MIIHTIGVYGFTAESFFAKLLSSRIDAFFDTRRRRGVRGSDYAFANARRLQDELNRLSIDYHYLIELAPTKEIRESQKQIDASVKEIKKNRTALSEIFVSRYLNEVCVPFDWDEFVKSALSQYKNPVFFCVEREPESCHRSLIAGELHNKFSFEVKHIKP